MSCQKKLNHNKVQVNDIKENGSLIKTFSGNTYKVSGDFCYLQHEFIIGGRKNTIHRTQMKLHYLYPNIRSVKDSSGIVIAKRLNKFCPLLSTNKGAFKRRKEITIHEVKVMSDRLIKQP